MGQNQVIITAFTATYLIPLHKTVFFQQGFIQEMIVNTVFREQPTILPKLHILLPDTEPNCFPLIIKVSAADWVQHCYIDDLRTICDQLAQTGHIQIKFAESILNPRVFRRIVGRMISLAVSVFCIRDQVLTQKVNTVYVLKTYNPPQVLGCYLQTAAAKRLCNDLFLS